MDLQCHGSHPPNHKKEHRERCSFCIASNVTTPIEAFMALSSDRVQIPSPPNIAKGPAISLIPLLCLEMPKRANPGLDIARRMRELTEIILLPDSCSIR